ncbi:MAG: hypothetical protein CAF45_002625 [Nitrospira sp. CG24E]|nr:MAG: hypothetical protein CAF45_002625 [Nitrospira sp. CG24E]
MKGNRTKLASVTRRLVTEIYGRLDYEALGPVYCYEGGDEFWRAKRGPCDRLGSRVAVALKKKLERGGRSLYVGAGVAELPTLIMETVELSRTVEPYNLRRAEVTVLNRACHSIPLTFRLADAASAKGRFDHLWIVSVLNDPERFPHLSPLSYGRGNPLTLDPLKFGKERRIVRALVARCMGTLARPGLVTTTTEEILWIAEWCHRHRVPYRVGKRNYPTALVGDPICFIHIGRVEKNGRVKRLK